MRSSDPFPGVGRRDAARGHHDGGVRRAVGQVAGERAGLLDALHTGDRDGPGGLLARAEVARRADQGRGSGGERARPVT